MTRAHKDAVYEQLARIGKALSAPRRLELVDLLGQAPRTVESLAEHTGMSVANTSRHLQALRAAGLVESQKEGLYVTYRLAGSDVGALFRTLRSVAESRLAEMERVKRQFFTSTGELDAVSGKELILRVRRGRALLLDVRPAEEYQAGHIAGAICIPLPELSRRLGELSKRRQIVAYCRGPYCVLAAQAVKLLESRGYSAARLEDGVAEWSARGLPTSRAAEVS